VKDGFRHLEQQHLRPFAEFKPPAAIELVVGPADEAVQVLHRVLRQLIGIGQGQVGAGGAV
jgi:hypothetical protein